LIWDFGSRNRGFMKFNLPIHRRLFLSHFMAVLLVLGTIGTYLYLSAVESLKTSLQSRLSSSAALLSQILDPTKLDTIHGEADQSLPVYQEYLELLRVIRRSNADIAYMYVMRRDGERVTFVIDSDETEKQASPGREYDTSVPALLEGFSHPSVDSEIVTDEWGSTLSGYAPIQNGQGKYLIGIDMDATEVRNKFRGIYFSGLVSLLLGSILTMFLSRYLASRFTTPITMLISRCKAMAEGDFHSEVKLRTRDELGNLIEEFNNMSNRLSESREQCRLAEEALKQSNEELEVRIGERTKDLKELNKKLLSEVDMRSQIMDALRASEQRYKELADLLPQPVFEAGARGNLTFLNRAAFETFGYSREDLNSGLELDEILTTDESKRILLESRQLADGATVDGAEHTAKKRDGSTFPVCTYVSSILTGDKPGGVRGIIIDITEHKRMEDELLKAQKLESSSVLAAGIAHDFNNLLTAIMGSVSLARHLIGTGTGTDEKLIKLLSTAERASLQAQNLTNQLISLTKGDGSVRSTSSIRDCIGNMVQPALRGSNVKCSFQMDEDLWPIFCDPGQIQQMVANLVMNSKEAMPEGGSIEIEARNIEVTPFEVPSLRAGKYVKLTIKDHGPGISEEDLPRIFDPYFSTKQRGSQKGMGLGLTIAYSIVKRHEGSISMRSSPGMGTAVDVYLPVSEWEPDETRNGSELTPIPNKEHLPS
jgi:PAS domain S-box-containing protein